MTREKKFVKIILILSLVLLTSILIKISKTNEIYWIKDSYYENNSEAMFTTDIMFDKYNNNINIYNTYWAINICGKNINSTIKESVSSYINKIDNLTIDNINSLYDLFYMSALDKYIDDNLNNKEYYLNRLLKNYDKKNKMFFLKSQSDSLEEKIAANNIAIKILSNIFQKDGYNEELNDIILELKESSLKLFENDQYFTYDDEEVNLINIGLPIFENIVLLGNITDIELNDFYLKRVDWFNYWENYIESIKNHSEISLIYINSIIKYKGIYNALGIEKEIVVNDLYKDENLINNIIEVDMQLAYQLMNISEIKNTKYIDDYINKSSFMWIYNNKPISLVEDLYYGTYLSDSYKFKYDKNKVKNYFLNYINNLSELKIKDLYYIDKLYNKFNLKESDFVNVEISAINEYINNIEDIDQFQLRDIYLALNVSKSYDYLENSYLKLLNKINKEYIDKNINNSENLEQLYYLLKISEYSSINIDNKYLEDKVFKIYNNSEYKDIKSIYYTLSILIELDTDINSYKNNIYYDFIELKGKDKEYFIVKPENKNDLENYKSNFTLESNYFGYKIEELFNKEN
ncbi:hypothetical protein H9660_15130 [Clostridium sp. Sa3CUN1]|uniref:Uncharacterized protein n=1 Tax=Clostridium gallinarum TaxID=2762246 RepID=A0ABR8Q7S0_9CLOT|nr:hypothetical protein [Clostridium gallinarum]MBD7916476.1 hypothetical protein [Clostridium gallinarum]